MTAIMSAYVGLQLLNTGPNAAPNKMSFFMPFLPCDMPIKRLVSVASPVAIINFSQRTGKSKLIPNSSTIPPDIIAQITVGTPSNAVVAFKMSVNATIESTRLVMITRGCLSDIFF